jgi:hypothetical protein
MFSIAQRYMLLQQFRIMPLFDGMALKIALPQGGIVMLAVGEMRLSSQFSILYQPAMT